MDSHQRVPGHQPLVSEKCRSGRKRCLMWCAIRSPESVGIGEALPWAKVSDVSRPTMTVYAPKGRNTGAAVQVFPAVAIKS